MARIKEEDDDDDVDMTCTPNARQVLRNRKSKKQKYRADLKSWNRGTVPDDRHIAAWDNLKLPVYAGDFEHILRGVTYIGFLKDLEALNGNLILPMPVVDVKWSKLVWEKYAVWVDDSRSDTEKSFMLAEALDQVTLASYDEYRTKAMGVDRWSELEAKRMKERDEQREVRKKAKLGRCEQPTRFTGAKTERIEDGQPLIKSDPDVEMN